MPFCATQSAFAVPRRQTSGSPRHTQTQPAKNPNPPKTLKHANPTNQVSIDPQRVYVSDPAACKHTCVPASEPGPNGEAFCWWQCTVKGGREARDIDAVAVARAVEALGAGEIMLNCINNDGKGQVGGQREVGGLNHDPGNSKSTGFLTTFEANGKNPPHRQPTQPSSSLQPKPPGL